MWNTLKERTYKTLRSSEKYTKTDMVYLAKGGTPILISHIVSVLTSFALIYIFANFLPKEIYGNYKYILSTTGLLMAFSLSGIGTALIQSVSRGFDSSLITAFRRTLLHGIIFTFVSLVLGAYYFLNDNNLLAISFIVVAFLQPLIQSTEVYASYLTGKRKFALNSKYTIIRAVLSTSAIIIAALVSENPFIIVLTFFISHLLITSVIYYFVRKNISSGEKDENLTRYAQHLSLANVISHIAEQIDKVLVFQLIGAQQLAAYAIAIAIPDQIKGLAKKIISPLALPKFSNSDDKDFIKNILNKTLLLLAIMTLIVIAYVLVAPFIFKIFFPTYSESILISQIFAFSIIFTAILPKTGIDAKKLVKANYALKLSSSILRIAIVFISISVGGVIGLAIGIVVSRAITLVLTTSFLIRGQTKRKLTYTQ